MTVPFITAAGRRLPAGAARRGVLAAGLLQLLVLLLTYGKLLLHPGQYLIVDYYDGAKSYFSLATFLRQPLGQGLLEHGQNYPFGEYIFYTDVAPLLSVPLHALVQAVPALAPYGLYLFDVFFLSGLVLSSLLLASVLRRLGGPAWLVLVLSIGLPWLSPQAYRLLVGHISLSYAPALLLPLWLLQGLHRAGRQGRPTGRWWLALGAAAVAASWLHFYYLGIVGGWVAGFGGIWALREARAGRPWRPLVGRLLVLLATLVGLTFGVVQGLDKYRAARTPGSAGYDVLEWKFQPGALLKGPDFYKIRFVVERTAAVPYESTAYLGAFVLYGLLVVGGLALVDRQRQQGGAGGPTLLPPVPPAATDSSREFLTLLLLASLPLALVSLGETVLLDDGAYLVHNYLNGFMWVHKFTERIMQFRALGRFIWPFWWALVLGFGWYAGLAWRQAQATRLGWLRALWLVLAGLAVVDTLHATHYYATATQRPNFLAPAATDAVRQRLGLDWADFGRYQALLTLPFYHSGTEVMDEPFVGIEPDDAYCTLTYQLGLATGLPTMAHKATRTPAYQARELLGMFRAGGPDPALLARLDSRPILVYLDSAYYAGGNNFYRDQLQNRPEMLALFNRTPAFIREQHMRRLRHEGTVSLYEWQPRK